MKSFFSKEVLSHPLILGAVVAAALIAGGGIWYYSGASQAPSSDVPQDAASASAPLTGSGTLEPAQNPDLAFLSGGRVASVNAAVGAAVARGSLLASLDTAGLSATRAQAQANLKAAQAKLSQLQAGPRDVDLQSKQTAVSQAQQSLQNLYQGLPNDLNAAYSNSLGAIHAYSDPLFDNPDTISPALVFQTSDTQAAQDTLSARVRVNGALSDWKGELAGLGTDSASLDQALAADLARMLILRTYLNTLTETLGGVITTTSFPQSSVITANANLASLRASINASTAALQSDSQQLSSAKLAVTAAQNALAQLQAGASAQDIAAQQAAVEAAQASVDAANAAIANAVVVAPFAGTVTSVHVKQGDIVAPNTVAVSLTPQSALQIPVYFSAIDAARLSPGDHADVTLDAYGAGRHWSAAVSTVDRSPTMQNGVPAYRVVLVLDQNDPSLASGSTANVSITPSR